MTHFSELGRVGSVNLKKTAGAGPLLVNTQLSIPVISVQPFNPYNTSYLSAINSSQNTSLAVAGNKTPAIAIRTCLKSSWATAALINSLILYTDATTGYTDTFGIQVKGQYGTRIYSLGKCTGITFTHTKQGAQPGPVMVDMGFACRYGDSEDPSLPTFTGPATDAGQLISACQVAWASTADQVKSFQLSLAREQAYMFSDTGNCYAEEIASGGFDGGLALVQSSTYTITPASTATINMGAAAAGIAVALNLDLFNPYTPQDSGWIMYNAGYKLANLSTGAIPCAVTAL